jgi:hypothetical protein
MIQIGGGSTTSPSRTRIIDGTTLMEKRSFGQLNLKKDSFDSVGMWINGIHIHPQSSFSTRASFIRRPVPWISYK